MKSGRSVMKRVPFCHNQNSESKLFTGDTSKDNHSPGPVIRGVSHLPSQEKKI